MGTIKESVLDFRNAIGKKTSVAFVVLHSIFLVAIAFIGCCAGDTKAQSQEPVSEIPEALEIVHQKDGDNSIHYILRDNKTGYEYIVVVRTAGAGGISTSITPRLGIGGHNPQTPTT